MTDIRPKDLPAVTAPTAADKITLDGATTRGITYENLFLKAPPMRSIGTDALGGGTRWFRASGAVYTEAYMAASGLGGTSDALNFYSSFSAAIVASIGRDGAIVAAGGIQSVSATLGIGYATGAGGAVTQATSRTTGVTLDKVSGAITLVSAAGSATYASFTVTNSTVAATDTIRVNQKSGTDLYEIHVTAVAAGSFRVTFRTTGGTTTEQPVFNFAVIKGVTA